jgi:hypothetical protein
MTELGKYCKAYPVGRLREYRDWRERREQMRTREWVGEDGSLSDDAYFFVQENLVVTDGIAKNEHVIFETVTPEWRAFCVETLGFPSDRIEEQLEQGSASAAPVES